VLLAQQQQQQQQGTTGASGQMADVVLDSKQHPGSIADQSLLETTAVVLQNQRGSGHGAAAGFHVSVSTLKTLAE
jgi:hypothetical protein